MISPLVIPGRDEVASPESITTIVHMDSGPAPCGASRNDEGESVPDDYFNAAMSFVAVSSSTLTSSLRLAGGSSAMPSWRGMMWTCR